MWEIIRGLDCHERSWEDTDSPVVIWFTCIDKDGAITGTFCARMYEDGTTVPLWRTPDTCISPQHFDNFREDTERAAAALGKVESAFRSAGILAERIVYPDGG